jgi:hypothetical protein
MLRVGIMGMFGGLHHKKIKNDIEPISQYLLLLSY